MIMRFTAAEAAEPQDWRQARPLRAAVCLRLAHPAEDAEVPAKGWPSWRVTNQIICRAYGRRCVGTSDRLGCGAAECRFIFASVYSAVMLFKLAYLPRPLYPDARIVA